jgi:acetyl-CoA C-acetyltransferase
MSRRVAVAATGQTLLRSRWADRQHIDLIFEAVSTALRGSPFTIRDVDFVIDSGSDVLDGRSISNCGFLGAMGAHHKEESRVEEDGLWAVWYAWQKILSGEADVGLVVAYSKPSESDVSEFWSTQCEPFYQRPVGLDNHVASALQAQQYLETTGGSADAFAAVAAFDWANAAANPRVDVDGAPDADEIAGSAPLWSPLTELTTSRYVDGAVAVVLVSQEVAEKANEDPVWLSGVGTAMDEHMLGARERGRLSGCEAAARTAYRIAGLESPTDVDVVEISAPSAAGELMVVEALGLADAGRGAELFSKDGDGPALNPSGGALPADPVMATGLVRFAEAALQLSGQAGDQQVDNASSAIVHGSGGVGMQNNCVAVLERG